MARKRILLSLVAFAAVGMLACGGGDKKSTTVAPSETPEPSAAAATAVKSPHASDATSSEAGKKTIGSIFSTLFTSGALSGPDGGGDTGSPELAPGDPALEKYVLTADDLPPGFTLQQTGSVQVPDGISQAGRGDVAMSIATKGDPKADDPRGSVMLMSMAMKFDDLQALGQALEDAQGMTEQQLRDALSTTTDGIPGLGLTNVQVLDANGLGDGGFGMTMTLDLGGFLKALQGAFAGADATPDPALEDFVINMKMYVFGRGDLGAGVISMSFGSGASTGVDEAALAKVIDEKLKAAH